MTRLSIEAQEKLRVNDLRNLAAIISKLSDPQFFFTFRLLTVSDFNCLSMMSTGTR